MNMSPPVLPGFDGLGNEEGTFGFGGLGGGTTNGFGRFGGGAGLLEGTKVVGDTLEGGLEGWLDGPTVLKESVLEPPPPLRFVKYEASVVRDRSTPYNIEGEVGARENIGAMVSRHNFNCLPLLAVVGSCWGIFVSDAVERKNKKPQCTHKDVSVPLYWHELHSIGAGCAELS